MTEAKRRVRTAFPGVSWEGVQGAMARLSEGAYDSVDVTRVRGRFGAPDTFNVLAYYTDLEKRAEGRDRRKSV